MEVGDEYYIVVEQKLSRPSSGIADALSNLYSAITKGYVLTITI